jgi:hypothetical protein
MKHILPILLLLFATTAFADPPVMTWEDNFGGVHYTDSEEVVPAMYLDRVEYVVPAAMGRITPMSPGVSEAHAAYLDSRLAELRARPIPPNLNLINPCRGHLIVKKVRVQEGDYNRTKVVVIDACGDVVSVSGQYPDCRHGE